VIVIRNVLKWVPVMLLAMPKRHMTQAELWTDDAVAQVARVAARVGAEHCPNGFRLVANLGPDAMQSQDHGHLHILGGTFLGEYV
jgi:histidine triad (HIT) family protein